MNVKVEGKPPWMRYKRLMSKLEESNCGQGIRDECYIFCILRYPWWTGSTSRSWRQWQGLWRGMIGPLVGFSSSSRATSFRLENKKPYLVNYTKYYLVFNIFSCHQWWRVEKTEGLHLRLQLGDAAISWTLTSLLSKDKATNDWLNCSTGWATLKLQFSWCTNIP